MEILADIGGTYARFGVRTHAGPREIRKYKAASFPGLAEALEMYCSDIRVEPSGILRIATAGYEDGGLWKFVNKNRWVIDPAALEKAGWRVPVILNDFEAATWALKTLDGGELDVLRVGEGASGNYCLIGPGTGLGLGYMPGGAGAGVGARPATVQKTHGGHMPVAAVTDEQWLVVQTVRRLGKSGAVPVFEDFVSGPGLYELYAARCLIAGRPCRLSCAEELAENPHDAEAGAALRLFHEFFGLFAATAVVCGHAYGGLYLGGGVTDRLAGAGLFDFAHFEKFFTLDVAASVRRDLSATPVIRVVSPYPALKGLMVYGDG